MTVGPNWSVRRLRDPAKARTAQIGQLAGSSAIPLERLIIGFNLL